MNAAVPATQEASERAVRLEQAWAVVRGYVAHWYLTWDAEQIMADPLPSPTQAQLEKQVLESTRVCWPEMVGEFFNPTDLRAFVATACHEMLKMRWISELPVGTPTRAELNKEWGTPPYGIHGYVPDET